MTLRDSFVVVLVNASLCVNVVMVNVIARTAVTSSTAVCYTFVSSFSTLFSYSKNDPTFLKIARYQVGFYFVTHDMIA